jgi:hypothetical protein
MKLLCLETLCLFEFVAGWKIHLVSGTLLQTRSRQREVPCLNYVVPVINEGRGNQKKFERLVTMSRIATFS